jgi:ABC-type nickel/cobalt efflux system permease component RcnA
MPPGADGSAVTWRSLLLLGISGGLLPCPSALVVMLGAIALQRVGFGLLLIVAFSLGLAGVLTAIGVALVYAGRLFERLPVDGRLLRIMPVVSAVVITVLGMGITLQALFDVL